ncbi:DinB family protein [Chitinophaga oryziterrae]|uniref:DinB family protein n=1 Tax=Chitinophaga oryziterrae TaxID=1031224 RepID=A0A6N8J6U1_9BACT|nr:DinB family protein [Chitinophaga oryziterrae]MVT40318.1 DinB family protein [Chitinophaga oryziterrae]
MEFENTAAELIKTLSSFSETEINVVPFEGSWTAGQVGEHIYKSVSGVSQVLQGAVTSTERNPGEKIKIIGDLFLNFNEKFKSPEFIIPSDQPHDKNLLLKSLTLTLNEVGDNIKKQDQSLTCLEFALPGFGELTRMEWNHFIVVHTQRHIHQLKNIGEHVKKGVIQK